MYAPDQGLFKMELSVTRGRSGYEASLQLPGVEKISARLGSAPTGMSEVGRMPPGIYGKRLFEWVFRDAALHEGLMLVRDLSRRSPDELPSMRLLLRLDPASTLSEYCWETLCPSETEPPLSVTTAFSRFVPGERPSRPPVWERPVRILLVVSNPEGLQQFDLGAVDQNLERAVLKEAELRLEGRIEVKRLFRPTLESIRSHEREGFHITHLLAHAMVENEHGYVLLADTSGKAESIGLEQVADAIASPSDVRAPYLVFLALPLNAEAPNGRILMNLASLLIRAGVQSVVVIQAPIEAATLDRACRGTEVGCISQRRQPKEHQVLVLG